jgi:hypothetical protein
MTYRRPADDQDIELVDVRNDLAIAIVVIEFVLLDQRVCLMVSFIFDDIQVRPLFDSVRPLWNPYSKREGERMSQ